MHTYRAHTTRYRLHFHGADWELQISYLIANTAGLIQHSKKDELARFEEFKSSITSTLYISYESWLTTRDFMSGWSWDKFPSQHFIIVNNLNDLANSTAHNRGLFSTLLLTVFNSNVWKKWCTKLCFSIILCRRKCQKECPILYVQKQCRIFYALARIVRPFA